MFGMYHKLWLTALLWGLCLPLRLLAQAPTAPVQTLHRVYAASKAIFSEPRTAPDNRGGTFVVFRATQSGEDFATLTAQKVSAQGVLEWALEGVPVSSKASAQLNHEVVADGQGGCFVVWEDLRDGRSRVFAQHLSADGKRIWASEGVPVTAHSRIQTRPTLATDYVGGIYIAWEEENAALKERDIHCQRMNAAGVYQFSPAGIPVVTGQGVQQNPQIASTPSQGLLVLWEDFRSGKRWELFAQQLALDGRQVWANGGVALTPPRNLAQRYPSIFSDGFGGMICVYEALGGLNIDKDLYVLRVSKAGKIVYQKPICAIYSDQTRPKVLKRGSDAWVVWEDYRNGNADIFFQRFDLNTGEVAYELDGRAACVAPGDQLAPRIAFSSLVGEPVIAWEDRREPTRALHAQKLDEQGRTRWSPAGLKIASNLPLGLDFDLVGDERGGAWLAWIETAEQQGLPRARHVLADGAMLPPDQGVALQAPSIQHYAKVEHPVVAQGFARDAFVAWEDYRAGEKDSDIFLQRLDASGRPLWRTSGIPVGAAAGSRQSLPVLLAVPGGVYVGWIDRRNNDDNLYMQFVDTSGRLRWRADGLAVCLAPRSQNSLRLVRIGQGSDVLAVWADGRDFLRNGFDLYCQRLTPAGAQTFQQDGKLLAGGSGFQTSPQAVSDRTGGAWVVWMDEQGGRYNIQYLKLDGNFGPASGSIPGTPLARSGEMQRYPEVAASNVGALFAVWTQSPANAEHSLLNLQAVGRMGSLLRAGGSLPVSPTAAGSQDNPRIVSAGGSFAITWLDSRQAPDGTRDLYLQFMSPEGQALWGEMGQTIGRLLPENSQYTLCWHDQQQRLYAVWQEGGSSARRKLTMASASPASRQTGWLGPPVPDLAPEQAHPQLFLLAGRPAIVWVDANPKQKEAALRFRFLD